MRHFSNSAVCLVLKSPQRCGPRYVPRDKRTNTNIELAFVNFVSHSVAKKVYSKVVRRNKELIWDTVVSAGNIQGFHWNLAYFLARFGVRATLEADAPLIFRDGILLQERRGHVFGGPEDRRKSRPRARPCLHNMGAVVLEPMPTITEYSGYGGTICKQLHA